MAIEGDAARVPLSLCKRLDGLNHIATLREKVFGLNYEQELERFIEEMRDPRDVNKIQNERALAAIFFMAKIPADRHGVHINDLTTDEKRELIKAMNHFRAVVSLFPKRLTMPN
jgi:hypothetical protein